MFWVWLAETLCHSVILGWAAEHFESDSQNLAGMFSYNLVVQSCTVGFNRWTLTTSVLSCRHPLPQIQM